MTRWVGITATLMISSFKHESVVAEIRKMRLEWIGLLPMLAEGLNVCRRISRAS